MLAEAKLLAPFKYSSGIPVADDMTCFKSSLLPRLFHWAEKTYQIHIGSFD
jgi:hypothetical protein